jgi:hypothetical protein
MLSTSLLPHYKFLSGASIRFRVVASFFWGFAIAIIGHATFRRTLLDGWSARRRDLYLATHNNHRRQTSMTRRDSNPQSQQASGCIPMPYSARPLGSAGNYSSLINFDDMKFDSTKILSVILKSFSFIWRMETVISLPHVMNDDTLLIIYFLELT